MDCGAEVTPKGYPTTKKVQTALTAACRQCSEPVRYSHCGNWWTEFGLAKNPYVYGPMPWKRTSEFWRRVEARERGWPAWHWSDCQYSVVQR